MSILEKVDIISVKNRNFVAIGKMTFTTGDRKWNIPHLHFIINKCSDGVFESVCIELMEMSSGKDVQESVKNLGLDILQYLNMVVKKADDLDNLLDCVDTHDMDGYWREYRKIDFKLAKIGKDVNNELENIIRKEIKEEYEKEYREKLKEIEKKIGKNLEEYTYANFELKPILNIETIGVKSIEEYKAA